MADYRDHAAETAASRARQDEEMATGYRRDIFRSQVICVACGCVIGDQKIHREKCPWTPKRPKVVYE